MATMRVSRVLHAPIERVWQVFADIPAAADRLSGVSKIDVLSDLPFGPGFRWRETRRMLGKDATEEMWVSMAQEPDFYEVAAASRGMEYLSRYDFTAVPDGTKVELVFTGTPTSTMAKLMDKTMALTSGPLRKALSQDMADLAAVCEAE